MGVHWTCCGLGGACIREYIYQVQLPINSLWHLDGYHKLIRWKFIIRGGIDRLITFLKVSTDNNASTVLSAFVDEFGLPSRIRIDREGEDYLVSQFMLEHPERGLD